MAFSKRLGNIVCIADLKKCLVGSKILVDKDAGETSSFL